MVTVVCVANFFALSAFSKLGKRESCEKWGHYFHRWQRQQQQQQQRLRIRKHRTTMHLLLRSTVHILPYDNNINFSQEKESPCINKRASNSIFRHATSPLYCICTSYITQKATTVHLFAQRKVHFESNADSRAINQLRKERRRR